MQETMRGRDPSRLIVAVTGATGAIYAARMLQALRELHGSRRTFVIPAHRAYA